MRDWTCYIQFVEDGVKKQVFEVRSWTELLKLIDRKMSEQEIIYPLGEDDEQKDVRKEVAATDKFVG